MDRSNHCGTCLHHGFETVDGKPENWCRHWGQVIVRERWDKKRKDGTWQCSCDEYEKWDKK